MRPPIRFLSDLSTADLAATLVFAIGNGDVGLARALVRLLRGRLQLSGTGRKAVRRGR